jgi:predicted phage-related endonuclease
MSALRHYRRGIQPRRLQIARAMEKLQAIEPDPRKLKDNFPEILERMVRQTNVETYAPKGYEQGK